MSQDDFQMPLHEVLSTQRALRRVTAEPVADELILQLIEYGTRAPNAGNEQRWEFVLVRADEIKQQLAQQNRFLWQFVRGHERKKEAGFAGRAHTNAAMEWAVEHFAEYPAMIVACHRGTTFPWPPILAASLYGSLLPAVQNILLAARAAGLGANFTTMPLWNTWKARRILELPRSLTPSVLITLGWPQGSYGPSRRQPVGNVVSLDRYGHKPWFGKQADEVQTP